MTIALFLLLMNKEYRGAFWSTKRGKTVTKELFASADDAVKQNVLNCNKNRWAGIREDAKEWALGKWYSWMEDKPEWCTDAWIAKVPDDFVPDDEDQSMLTEIRKNGGKKRGKQGSMVAVAND